MLLGKKVELFVLQQEIIFLEKRLERLNEIKENTRRLLFDMTYESPGLELSYISLKNRIQDIKNQIEEKKDLIFNLEKNV